MTKYSALVIKNWVVTEISPMAWVAVISRALPELLESNPNFSAYYITKKTKWKEIEVEILQFYLLRMYNKFIPSDLLVENSSAGLNYLDLVGISFFSSKNFAPLQGLKRLFKTTNHE